MVDKYPRMRQICNILHIVSLILFVSSVSKGQTNPGFTYSTGNSFFTRVIYELEDGSIVVYKEPYASDEPSGLLKFSPSGQLIQSYDRTDTYIVDVHQTQNGFTLFTTDSVNWFGNYRCIILDNELNPIQETLLTKHNFPRAYVFRPTSLMRKGKLYYFTYFISNPAQPNSLQGWLSYSSGFDSIIAEPIFFETDTQRIISISNWNDSLYFTTSTQEGVNISGISGALTTVLRLFDDSLRHLLRRNIYVPSSIPNYPRFGGSENMIKLHPNEHSVYGSSRYIGVSSNFFSERQEAFTTYQFDHNLNLRRIRQELSGFGRIALTPFSSTGVALSITGKYLFVLGTNAEPRPPTGDDQNRTGALTIMKLDTALNLIWRTEIEIPKTYLEASSFVATADGGVLIAANRIDSFPNPNIRNLFVVKVDSVGRQSVSVEPQFGNKSIKLYPQPANEFVYVQFNESQFDEILLYNAAGQLLRKQTLEPGTSLHRIEIASFAPGMYFYQLRSHLNFHQGKLIKR